MEFDEEEIQETIKTKKTRKQKKGFTLIELLAVIIILGILMIIAIPSVTSYINDSRKSAYVDTAKEIIAGARNLVNEGKLGMYDTNTVYYIPTSCIKTENASKSPYGEFEKGKTYVIVTYNGNSYNYYWMSVDETGQGIKTPISVDELDTSNIESDIDDIVLQTVENKKVLQIFDEQCGGSTIPDMAPNGTVMPVKECTFEGDLVQGAEYVSGQYTYRYMQQGKAVNSPTGVVIDRTWDNITADGWGVILTDKDSTAPVTSKLCTSINGKPIVSMSVMFGAAKTSSIDFSSFDTSNVYNMNLMFAYAPNLTKVDLSNFDTRNLKYFGNTFLGCGSLTDVNLDNFDFTNSVSVGAVFIGADNLKTLSLKNWVVSTNIVNFLYRLWSVNDLSIESIDVSNWDLSHTESLSALFAGHGRDTTLKTIKGLETWNTSHIKNMNALFQFNGNVTTLDLSSWDLSSVTDVDRILQGCSRLTTVYVKTQADADKLNGSSYKPVGVSFIIK